MHTRMKVIVELWSFYWSFYKKKLKSTFLVLSRDKLLIIITVISTKVVASILIVRCVIKTLSKKHTETLHFSTPHPV